jgi:Protein of unknown function (DUF3455)
VNKASDPETRQRRTSRAWDAAAEKSDTLSDASDTICRPYVANGVLWLGTLAAHWVAMSKAKQLRVSTLRSVWLASTLTLAISTACGAEAPDSTELEEATESQAEGLSLHAPSIPDASLAVPAGNSYAFAYDAVGVQIYVCQAGAWVFQKPEATLYGFRGRVVGTHYAGPFWESTDGSKVKGAKLTGFTDDPTAIPELLLQATANEGSGRFSDVTYIQRLQTVGGLAPSAGCDSEHEGAIARTDYTAVYAFYKANRPCH